MVTVKHNLARVIHMILWGSVCVLGAATPAVWAAESSVDIGTVQATAEGAGMTGGAGQAQSAAYQAPSKTPLNVSQPTSVISQHYIAHNVVPTSNYDEVIKHTPSVTSIAPNGPGMMENMGLSIRGFQDGQYNITFDGIPWSDSNDFTHHTTSYLMAHDIGQVSVDRGPGTAATVGDATFGGTISIQTRNPSSASSFSPYTMFGSFGTQLYGMEYNTGTQNQYNGTKALLDYEHEHSDGYLTHAGLNRDNIFLKVQRPIGTNTLVTFAAMYNSLHQNVPLGATKAQIAKYGANYGLSSDPTKQNFYGYNYDDIKTDFEYIDLQSYLGNSWSVDNKLYTNAYYHWGFNGADPNGETANGTSWGTSNVPGQKMTMQYRSFGDFARFAKDLSIGTLNTGLWLDRQTNTRWQYEVDWTLGGALNPTNSSSALSTATDRLMNDSLTSIQPYVELAWKVSPKMTITPGVKYAYFRRTLDAQVNQKTGAPLSYAKSWGEALPSIDLHYHIQPGWVAYAQAAKGFLAPNLNTFYASDPSASDVKPEETMNYQAGSTWKSDRLSLSGDLYYIDFNNLVQHRTVGANTVFYNDGGVIYKGMELEGTYYVGDGYSLYANGSWNSAKTKGTNQWVANAPDHTAAAGLIYNRKGWYGSVMDKFVGHRYGDDGQTQPLGAYSITDMSLGYTLKHGAPSWVQKAKVNFQVNNVFNKKDIYALAGYTGGANTPLYWTIPERSYYISLSANF